MNAQHSRQRRRQRRTERERDKEEQLIEELRSSSIWVSQSASESLSDRASREIEPVGEGRSRR
jgi:hypothetical protein